jgi:hypothetical protein
MLRPLPQRMSRGEGLEMTRMPTEGIRNRCTRLHRRWERGEGKLKGIIIVVVVLLAIYSAFKILPAYVNDYQLSDKMKEQARFAVVNRYSEEQIRENIFKSVQDLDIPAKREDIKIFANNSIVKISMQYTVPVDLLMYHVELHFTPSSENKALF